MTTFPQFGDAELQALLADTESALVERKESWRGDAPDTARQAVCAFANDLPGHRKPGILCIGVKDNGIPSGLTVGDELLRTLADIRTDGNILPPPTISVEKRRLGGSDVAVVVVMPSDAPPVRYRGRIWIRIGSRRAVATAQDERVLNERRRYHEQPYDLRPVRSSSLGDLSAALFEEAYLPAAFAPEILAANARTYEQRLAACRMIVSADDPVPTLTGVVSLGRDPRMHLPGAYVQFLRIDGTKMSDPIVDETRCEGPLSAMVQRIDDKLDAHNRTSVDITGGDRELRRSLYPKAALQQLVRNAVMHRTYEATNAPCRIYWFNDRIEIQNPGGPYGTVTRENFGTAGLNDYRNPNLADAMKVLGLVQRFGVGIQIARAELQKNGNPPPEFIVETTHVLAIVRTRPDNRNGKP